MNHPPPLPLVASSPRKLIIAAYIFSGLSLIPLFGFLAGMIGVVLGGLLCAKNKVNHGVAAIVISVLFAFVVGPIVTIAVLTVLGEYLQETFQQVTSELENQPTP